MDIGLVKDRRPFEHRVGLTPGAVRVLTERGHRFYVEDGAGVEAGFDNQTFERAGATVVYSEDDVLLRSEMVIRVSPPKPADYHRFQEGQIVVSSWHLALAPADAFKTLLERKVTTVGYEIIEEDDGRAPVLEAMSEIAGRLAVVMGSGLLLNEFGGKGLLICGAPGIPPASMVILGAGTLGRAAARYAQGIGAHVVVLDRNIDAMRKLQDHVGYDVPTMLATRPHIEKALAFADLFLCAVAVHGEKTPVLVTREMLGNMKPRSIIMDLSIDQGGCCETSRPTDFSSPIYEVDDIIHFCVPNLPSSASRASTRALTNSIFPFIEKIADGGFDSAIRSSAAIHRGTYTYNGHCVRRRLSDELGVSYLDVTAG